MFKKAKLQFSYLVLFFLLPMLLSCSKQKKEPLLAAAIPSTPASSDIGLVNKETAIVPTNSNHLSVIQSDGIPIEQNPLIDTEINPLSNPSFEQGLQDWETYDEPGFAIEAIAANGQKSLSLTPTEEGNQLLMRDFRLQVGQKYYLSAKVKTEGAVEGYVDVVYGASPHRESEYVQPNSDWTEVGVTFIGTTDTQDEWPDANPNTAYLQLRLGLETLGDGSSGKVYFDDIRVYKLIEYSSYVRVKLNAPENSRYGLLLNAYSEPMYDNIWIDYFADTGLQSGQFSEWINLGAIKRPDEEGDGADWGYGGFDGGETTYTGLAFIDMRGNLDYYDYKKLPEIDAIVQFAYAPNEGAIIADFHEQTQGGIVGYFVPQTESNPSQFTSGFRPLRDDAQLRNNYVHALNLPPVHLDKYFIEAALQGYNDLYSDPALAALEVDTLGTIGFSAMTEGYSDLSTPFREMAAKYGIAHTHETYRYWDSGKFYGRGEYGDEENAFMDLDWAQIEADINQEYDVWIAEMTAKDPDHIPLIDFVDIGDEISGVRFWGPQYNAHYRQYLQEHNITPPMLGKSGWDEVVPFDNLDWWTIDEQRPARDADITVRRNFYWTTRFWSFVTAKGHALETAVVADKLPGRPTRIDFGNPWSFDYTHYTSGVELWEFCRQKGITLPWNEEWLNTYGWRHAGIQLNAYMTDLDRSCGAVHDMPVGAFVMTESKENVQLKLASVIGKAAKYINLYFYGPIYANFDHWSDNLDMVEGVADFVRLLDKSEDILYPGQPRQADIAMLWAQSDPVWDWPRSGANTYDRQFTYLGLLHEQFTLDFVDEVGIAEENVLAKYKVLYLTGATYLRADAQEAIVQWVQDGGILWIDGDVGMGDEYAAPTTILDAALGIKKRAVTVSNNNEFQPGEGLEQQIPLDTITLTSGEMTEVIGRKVTFSLTDPDHTAVLGTYGDGSPAIIEHNYGQGKVRYAGAPVGLGYGWGVTHLLGKISTGYSAAKRSFITDLLHQSGVVRPVVSSVPLVEADLLESTAGIGVVLANYTGRPQTELTLTIAVKGKVTAVASAKLGNLPFTQHNDMVTVTLPLALVDFVTLER